MRERLFFSVFFLPKNIPRYDLITDSDVYPLTLPEMPSKLYETDCWNLGRILSTVSSRALFLHAFSQSAKIKLLFFFCLEFSRRDKIRSLFSILLTQANEKHARQTIPVLHNDCSNMNSTMT